MSKMVRLRLIGVVVGVLIALLIAVRMATTFTSSTQFVVMKTAADLKSERELVAVSLVLVSHYVMKGEGIVSPIVEPRAIAPEKYVERFGNGESAGIRIRTPRGNYFVSFVPTDSVLRVRIQRLF